MEGGRFFSCAARRGDLTLEHGADLPPGGQAALAGVLAQRRLQEEERDAAEEEEDKVRDEEDTCKTQRAGHGAQFEDPPGRRLKSLLVFKGWH